MVYNPDTWATETILSEAEQLRRMLVHYFETGAGDAFWKTKVVPIIQRMVKSGIATSVKGAVALTGDFIVEKGAVVWISRKTTRMILQETGVLSAEGIVRGLLGAANIFGWVLMLTSEASAESPERQWEYQNYLKKYLTYLIKVSSLGGNHINNMMPAMSFQQWQESRTGETEWWQR